MNQRKDNALTSHAHTRWQALLNQLRWGQAEAEGAAEPAEM